MFEKAKRESTIYGLHIYSYERVKLKFPYTWNSAPQRRQVKSSVPDLGHLSPKVSKRPTSPQKMLLLLPLVSHKNLMVRVYCSQHYTVTTGQTGQSTSFLVASFVVQEGSFRLPRGKKSSLSYPLWTLRSVLMGSQQVIAIGATLVWLFWNNWPCSG